MDEEYKIPEPTLGLEIVKDYLKDNKEIDDDSLFILKNLWLFQL